MSERVRTRSCKRPQRWRCQAGATQPARRRFFSSPPPALSLSTVPRARAQGLAYMHLRTEQIHQLAGTDASRLKAAANRFRASALSEACQLTTSSTGWRRVLRGRLLSSSRARESPMSTSGRRSPALLCGPSLATPFLPFPPRSSLVLPRGQPLVSFLGKKEPLSPRVRPPVRARRTLRGFVSPRCDPVRCPFPSSCFLPLPSLCELVPLACLDNVHASAPPARRSRHPASQ